MSGTLEGGRKAAATDKAKYGKEFYSNMGIHYTIDELCGEEEE